MCESWRPRFLKILILTVHIPVNKMCVGGMQPSSTDGSVFSLVPSRVWQQDGQQANDLQKVRPHTSKRENINSPRAHSALCIEPEPSEGTRRVSL